MIHTEALDMSAHKTVKIHVRDEIRICIIFGHACYLISSNMTILSTFKNAEAQDIQNSNFRDSHVWV
jgi:hypothetical protein